jgi:hypothetical protein
MAFFRYAPPADAGADVTNLAFGVEFVTDGVAVEVTDPFAVAKLRANHHFVELPAEPDDEPATETYGELTKEQIIALLHEIGAEYDGRWSRDRLAKLLAKLLDEKTA